MSESQTAKDPPKAAGAFPGNLSGHPNRCRAPTSPRHRSAPRGRENAPNSPSATRQHENQDDTPGATRQSTRPHASTPRSVIPRLRLDHITNESAGSRQGPTADLQQDRTGGGESSLVPPYRRRGCGGSGSAPARGPGPDRAQEPGIAGGISGTE